MIEAVVFDLDGTLFDHRGSATTALRRWLPELGRPASADLVQAWFAAEERHFETWRSREISFAEQRRRRLRDFLPLVGHPVGDDQALDVVFTGYVTRYQIAWAAFDDVRPALDQLTHLGLAVGVLTNGIREQQTAKLEAIGLHHLVGDLLTAEELGMAKPDPGTYLAACRRLGLAPERVLHVGDLHDLDVVAARKAGLHAVHLDRDDTGPHDEVDRITTLDELLPYLRRQSTAG